MVFNAFSTCSFNSIKGVILGQDPYHGPGQAMGLSFSVPEGLGVPISLVNIYKEIKSDVGCRAIYASTPQEDEISPQIKAEFEEWGAKTTGGVLAGMLYGGSREAASAAKTERSRLPIPHEGKMKPKGKIIREMTENKVLRIARGTVLGGAKLGAFVALFSGVQHGLAVHRSSHDTLNTVAAGAITGASFSFTLPGSLLTRLSSAAVGSILGGTVALPLGWLQSTLQAELNTVQDQEVQVAESRPSKAKYEEGQGVDAVIRRLESRAP